MYKGIKNKNVAISCIKNKYMKFLLKRLNIKLKELDSVLNNNNKKRVISWVTKQ